MPADKQARCGHAQPASQGYERGVHLVGPTTQHDATGTHCGSVSPRLTEWVPELLDQLREASTETVRTQTSHTNPWRASTSLLDTTLPEWNSLTDTWDDATAEAVAYTQAITELALVDCDTESSYHDRRHDELRNTVEAVGTGRGAVNAGLGALAKGPVALHRKFDHTPQAITLALDGSAWRALTDRRTGVRALAAIAVLAAGFDVRVVASPALQRHLTRRYPQWSAIHLGLTHSRDRSLQQGHRNADSRRTHTDTASSVWAALDGLRSAPGKCQLLGALGAETGRTYADLAADPDLDLERGTIGRYVLDLESQGLVVIDRRRGQNTARLTDRGETAVRECLTPTCELQHPDQTRLEHGLTATTHESSSTVSPPWEPTAADPTAVESWLAETGDADEAYVQSIDTHDAPAIHQRFTLPAASGAVTLVDDPIEPFDDGRVSYLSHHNEECLAVVQWGGPLATLGRLAGVLLSETALSEILTETRLGETFANIHGGTGAITASPGRTLRRGHQVGWFSEDEEVYEAWRDRIKTVRDTHLARLSILTDSSDSAARGELFEALHGLIASATQLYHAAGVELTVTLRLPDTEPFATNPTRRADLCDFIRHTVPKQTVYGVHSGYRMLFEERPAKLKRRLPYDVEAGAALEATASWVIAGPTATALQNDLAAALDDELGELRAAVANGDETAPALTIPVRDGTTYAALRGVVDAVADEYNTDWSPRIRRELTRFCLQAFGPDVPHRASPYDAVTCLIRATERPNRDGWLTTVTHAAATLPCERFRPDLPPTATKLYATLLRAATPCGRQALIERADISASSYDRHIGTVSELPRVQATTVDGYRKWIAQTHPAEDSGLPTQQVHHRIQHAPALEAGQRTLASTAVGMTAPPRSRAIEGAAGRPQADLMLVARQHYRWEQQHRATAGQLSAHHNRACREPHSPPRGCVADGPDFDTKVPTQSIRQPNFTAFGDSPTVHAVVNETIPQQYHQ